MSKDFKIPPVSTLLGADINTYFKILKGQDISPEFRFKIFLTTLIVFISTPFHWWDSLYYNNKKLKKVSFKKPPLFILGHWRSGTTLLHNLISQDPSFGYISTYQTIFPNNMASKAIFKTFLKIVIPERRPADNMKLGVDLPQEDEFAFSNMYYNNYYNFFYFPNNYKSYYDKSVRLKGLSDKEKDEFLNAYDKMLKKAFLNGKGERLVVKNPVNTARIKWLLKLYPDAKFLYIYRNPVTVFLSTHNFFKVIILKTLMLHRVSEEFIDEMIFDVYKMLIDDYLEQKSLIPKENLYELKYEDFSKNPSLHLKEIYENLLNEDYDNVKKYISSHLNSEEGHKKQQYQIDKKQLDIILNNFKKYMDIYGYDIPKGIVTK